MTLRLTGQRIRSGLWLPASVDDSYEIGKLTVPSDDIADEELWCISGDGSSPPQFARTTQNADESWSDDGTLKGAWRIPYMTFAMLPIFLTAAGLSSARSNEVTIMDYDEQNNPLFIQCKMVKPAFPSSDAAYAIGGWGSVIWRYSGGVIVTD